MEYESTYTETTKQEPISRYCDKDGKTIPNSNVYFRQDGTPYLLLTDENDEPLIMTRERVYEIPKSDPNADFSYEN